MSQAKHAEARELMYNGALLFFSYNQVHHTFLFCLLCVQCTHSHGNTLNRKIMLMCFAKALLIDFVYCLLLHNCVYYAKVYIL